ncbi:metal-dependent hydrolase [Caenimonas soli]|uniref:metal-dependent hydrolase n=1 Tax=Caenimonas soli TaxID=2735555 RepID=UPI001F401C4D|nr:metal-dependent hydrolase [Caenimonas soli]
MSSLRALLATCVLFSATLVSAQTAGKTEVLWLGQSATRITTPGGKVIVVDPWLTSNPKTPANFKALESIGKVDLILVTHAHFDHSADAAALAKMHNVPVYNAGGLGATLIGLDVLPPALVQRFGKGGTVMPFGPTGVKITGVRAEHASEFVWKNPATNKDEARYGGEPVGYIIEMENGFKIWHMGDTSVFGDMRLIADMYRPDLVIIPIGGHFTMNPADAALATREMIRPKYALPVHYGTNPALRGTPAEYRTALGNSPVQMLVVEPGQKVEF